MKKRTNKETMTFRSAAQRRALDRAERRVKKSGLGRIIASRVLHEENARDDQITVVVGAPRRVEADHWLCPYRIEGILESNIEYSYGVDALEALLSALAGAKYFLDQTKRRFVFLGDNHGIPIQVSTHYGKTFEQRVERAIRREWKRVELARLRQRKAEVRASEARLKVIKKYVARWPEARTTNLKREIAKQSARIKVAKKRNQSWEAELRK